MPFVRMCYFNEYTDHNSFKKEEEIYERNVVNKLQASAIVNYY